MQDVIPALPGPRGGASNRWREKSRSGDDACALLPEFSTSLLILTAVRRLVLPLLGLQVRFFSLGSDSLPECLSVRREEDSVALCCCWAVSLGWSHYPTWSSRDGQSVGPRQDSQKFSDELGRRRCREERDIASVFKSFHATSCTGPNPNINR
jgi:hypothetical protein